MRSYGRFSTYVVLALETTACIGGQVSLGDLPDGGAGPSQGQPAASPGYLSDGGAGPSQGQPAASPGYLSDGGAGSSQDQPDASLGYLSDGGAGSSQGQPDAMLLDAQPVPTDSPGGSWPNCPPFIPVRAGQLVPLGQEVDQVPSAYAADGGIAFAPKGSPCATYGWLGSTAIDECVTSSSAGWGGTDYDFALLPPCNWVAQAGAATAGPGVGQSRYQLCLNLYECMMESGCGEDPLGAVTCLCGHDGVGTVSCDASGPCAMEELAALEQTIDALKQPFDPVLLNYTDIQPGIPGYGGAALNQVFQDGLSNYCFPSVDAGE